MRAHASPDFRTLQTLTKQFCSTTAQLRQVLEWTCNVGVMAMQAVEIESGKSEQPVLEQLSTLLEFSALWILGSIKALLMVPLLSIFGTWLCAGPACNNLPPVLRLTAKVCLSVLIAPILATVVFFVEFGSAGFSSVESFGKFSAKNSEQRKVQFKNIFSLRK